MLGLSHKEVNTKIISTMARWSAVENNVVFVFRKTLESGICDPHKTIFENFIIRVNSGMNTVEALEMGITKINSIFLKNVFINIISILENNGDLKTLLTKFEYEAFKIEEALWDNNIKSYKDRILMIILILITLGSLIRMYAIGVTNQTLTIASSISMLCALIITWKVGQYKY